MEVLLAGVSLLFPAGTALASSDLPSPRSPDMQSTWCFAGGVPIGHADPVESLKTTVRVSAKLEDGMFKQFSMPCITSLAFYFQRICNAKD